MMKIILSRKGFDSENGGYPSPIFLDGKMVSLPIPSKDKTKYSELKLDVEQTYYDLMKLLNPRKKYENELTQDTTCHLDPDLIEGLYPRNKAWKPVFGQIGAAQGVLANNDVGEGDIFLFFGWFKKTIFNNGVLHFDNSALNLHMIFGYFQIGEIVNNTNTPDWIKKYHPHGSDEYRSNNTNTIYIAKDKLLDTQLPGAGTLKYNDDLVLTKPNQRLRTLWELPRLFYGLRITYHRPENQIINENDKCEFISASRGQEFVIEENDQVTNWAKKLIEKNYEL